MLIVMPARARALFTLRDVFAMRWLSHAWCYRATPRGVYLRRYARARYDSVRALRAIETSHKMRREHYARYAR